MAISYLNAVNKVLRRLREGTVTTVAATPYSAMVGELLNDVKNEVEDAWDWSALRTTFSITTGSGLFNYILTGTAGRATLFAAYNDTAKRELKYLTTAEAELKYLTPQYGSPTHFNFNGVDSNGDIQIDLWPIPDAAYTVTVNMKVPQADLELDADMLVVAQRPVLEGTIARAISERGEDGGRPSALADDRYRTALSDAISIDANLHPEELIFYTR